MRVAFTIIGQPASKANSRRLVTIRNRPALIKSKEALAYEKDARKQIPVEARVMMQGPVRVTLRIWYASERPDLDESVILDVLQARYERTKGALQKLAPGEYNYAKGERVLVQKGVYRNDRQVREKHVFHGIDKANPRAEIEVETMLAQQQAIDLESVDEDELEEAPF